MSTSTSASGAPRINQRRGPSGPPVSAQDRGPGSQTNPPPTATASGQQQANSDSRGQSQSDDKPKANKNYANLFVAALPRTLTNAELSTIFEPYNVSNAAIMMDVATGKSKGFGFISFPSERDGRNAIKKLNNKTVTVGEHSVLIRLSASKHDPKTAVDESPFVYFRNIPGMMTYEVIKSVFGTYGSVKNLQLRQDGEKDMWLAMAEYETTEEAKNAIKKCHGEVLFPNMSQLPVMAKHADQNAIRTLKEGQQPRRTHPRVPQPHTSSAPIRINPRHDSVPGGPDDSGSYYGSYSEGGSAFLMHTNSDLGSSSLPSSMPSSFMHSEPSSLMEHDYDAQYYGTGRESSAQFVQPHGSHGASYNDHSHGGSYHGQSHSSPAAYNAYDDEPTYEGSQAQMVSTPMPIVQHHRTSSHPGRSPSPNVTPGHSYRHDPYGDSGYVEA